MRTLPAPSTPARCAGSSAIVAVTEPEPSAVRSALPSVCDRLATGIVTVGVDPRSGGSGPATLLMMMAPIAPLACAFAACCGTVQLALRSMSAMLPETAAPFVNGVLQPSVVVPTPSATSTTLPVTPVVVSRG